MDGKARVAALTACGVGLAVLVVALMPRHGSPRVLMIIGLVVFEAAVAGGIISTVRKRGPKG